MPVPTHKRYYSGGSFRASLVPTLPMSAPTINANAAIFFKIILMIGVLFFGSLLLRQTKAKSDFYLLKQLNNSCSQIDNFSPISPPWYCVTPARDVRFGSKADICSATADVRFTLNSDRESGFPQMVTSALHPKADMCGAKRMSAKCQ